MFKIELNIWTNGCRAYHVLGNGAKKASLQWFHLRDLFYIASEYQKLVDEKSLYSPIDGYLEYEGNNYVLNTNYSNNKNHTNDMING